MPNAVNNSKKIIPWRYFVWHKINLPSRSFFLCYEILNVMLESIITEKIDTNYEYRPRHIVIKKKIKNRIFPSTLASLGGKFHRNILVYSLIWSTVLF